MSQVHHYDLAIIGAGSGGLSVAAGAAMLGAKVVLFEGDKMGGDCLNYGCVPSKSLLASSKAAHVYKLADRYGIAFHQPQVEMQDVIERVHGVIDTIAPHDSVERFTDLGVQVVQEEARFVSPGTIQAGNHKITARRFVIATGSSPVIPDIDGLKRVRFYTNETIFNLTEKPNHLIIIGGGPIGCEMAQAFLMLGIKVTLLQRSEILPRDERDLVGILRARLVSQGLNLFEHMKISRITSDHAGIHVQVEKEGLANTISGSHLLIAAGRQPNIENLQLDKAGVDYDARGISVDDRLRTSNKKIFAIGDVAGTYQFTHVANYHAGIVIRNALFGLPAKVDYRAVPWVTYTDIELAHAGLMSDEALKQDPRAKVLTMKLSAIDRAQTEHEVEGMIKVVANKKGQVLGVSILAPHAGELLLPWIMLIREKKTLRSITDAIVPYPTYSELSKRVASEFYKDKLFSPLVKRIVRFVQRF